MINDFQLVTIGTKNSILDAVMPIEHPLALLWTKLATLPTFPADKCQKQIQVSEEILMHRYKEEHIKMQIVSCQYFSRGGRIREGLQKKQNKNVQTQILLLVTTYMLTLLISQTAAK